MYKGYNSKTGDFVAVKQISLFGKKKDKIVDIKREINLLKTLDSEYIVKYIAHKEKDSYLYIIMEYV